MINDKTLPCILLLGGAGSRFSNINEPPKQLIKINKRTLLENLIIHLKKNGIKNFVLPLGYKKTFFYDYFKIQKKLGKFTFNLVLSKNKISLKKKDINIYLFDAGNKSSKLSRINQSLKLFNSESFFVSYGDGLADINIKNILKIYKKYNKPVISSTKINSQYGHLEIYKRNKKKKFIEKPLMEMPINIGYYLFNKKIFLENFSNKYELEGGFLKSLIKNNKLITYLHNGYFFNIDKKIDLVKIKKEKKKIIRKL